MGFVVAYSGPRPGDVPALAIGMAPSATSDPSWPLEGQSGLTLCSLMDCEWSDFADLFDRANLLDYHPAGGFPGRDARLSAGAMAQSGLLFRYHAVLLLGRSVADAFGLHRVPWLTWHHQLTGLPPIAVVPHPSRRNRWWNDDANTEAASVFLGRLYDYVDRRRDEPPPAFVCSKIP